VKGLARFNTTPRTTRRAITPEEIHRLLQVAPPDRRLLYEVALCTGLRANELRSLTVAHLDVERGGLLLDAAWTKNRRPGFQPLPTDLAERLAQATEDNEPTKALLFVPTQPGRVLNSDLKRAGIPKDLAGVGKLDFHAFRTAYATMVIESGATVKEAQTLLRHSTPTITMNTYARTRDERLARIAQRVGEIVLADRCAPKTPPRPSKAIPKHTATPSHKGGCEEVGLVAAVGLEPTTRGL
jgi:integrase